MAPVANVAPSVPVRMAPPIDDAALATGLKSPPETATRLETELEIEGSSEPQSQPQPEPVPEPGRAPDLEPGPEPQLEPEPEPEPEPEAVPPERNRYAVAVESGGRAISSSVMRGAVAIGTAAHAMKQKHVSSALQGDSGPLSKDTQEIIRLGQEVSEELLGATRVVASGVSTVLKYTGTAAVRVVDRVTTTAEHENDDHPKPPGRMQGLKDVGMAGIDAGVDIYYTVRKAGGVVAEGVTSAVAETVEYRHGAEAGRAAQAVGTTVTNLGNAAFNVHQVVWTGPRDMAV
eukprot:SAG25_NODE_1928_length_2139_cov_1.837255_1_plen_288_part_10